MTGSAYQARRLARIELNTPDAAALGRFYESGLGFRKLDDVCRDERGVSTSGRCVSFQLGREVITLRQLDRLGRPYPADLVASDLRFQHFAIVVVDMKAAYQRLCSLDGWSAISSRGPQRLPRSSGGVEAFKFRDPDGHPLELLAFPEDNKPLRWQRPATAGLFLGIDHSAISVSDSRRSVAFYAALGLSVVSRSINAGGEQARLDGLTEPRVEVTALAPARATPHVELLCYRSSQLVQTPALDDDDVAATRLVFDMKPMAGRNPTGLRTLADPDGHRLILIDLTDAGEASAP